MAKIRKLGRLLHTYKYIVMFLHIYTHHVENISIYNIINSWVCNKTPNFLIFHNLSGVDTNLILGQKIRSSNLT